MADDPPEQNILDGKTFIDLILCRYPRNVLAPLQSVGQDFVTAEVG